MSAFKLALDCGCQLGEGVLFSPRDERLYWVDIQAGALFRWAGVGAPERWVVAEKLGGITLQQDGSLLLFCENADIKCWREGEVRLIRRGPAREQGSRFNDVIAAPDGSVFCGTMPCGDQLGALYRLDAGLSLTPVLEDVGCSNGMGFSPDASRFYFTDSIPRTISVFDWREGAVSGRRTLVELPEGQGLPDGMTVDAEGCLWSAIWDGGCVARFSPEGREIARYPVPAPRVTSVAFAGEELYATTAASDGVPGSGGLFVMEAGVRGRSEFLSAVAIR